MKRYFLIIDGKKIIINILDDEKKNYKIKLKKLKEKYKGQINEMRFNDEIKRMIEKSKKKISEQDINLLLNNIKESLSVGDSPNSVKELFLETYKDDKDINPIFIVLLLSGHNIIDILKQLDFPKKDIYIETLESGKQYDAMYKDIMKIDKLSYMEEQLKKNIKKTAIFGIIMMTIAFILTLGFKFVLFPKINQFIESITSQLGNMHGMSGSSTSVTLVNILTVLVIAIYGLIILLLMFKKFLPTLYYKTALRLPQLGEIIRYQNDIYIFMLYSFNSAKATEFENKLKKFFSPYLKLNIFQYNDISHLVQKTFYKVKEELGTNAFHIRTYSFLKTVNKDPNPDKLLELKIKRYYEVIEEKTNMLKAFIQNGVLVLIGVIVGTLAITIFSVVSETRNQIQQVQSHH